MDIINDSLKFGKVPDEWKIAVIEPIEKVKNAAYPEQFRPGLGNFNMLVSNDLFRHDKVGLGM